MQPIQSSVESPALPLQRLEDIRVCTNHGESSFYDLSFITKQTTPQQFDEFVNSNPEYNLRMQGKSQISALSEAAWVGNAALIHYIVAKGGRELLNLGNKNGWTPLMHALYSDHLGNKSAFLGVKALVRLGADVNLATYQKSFHTLRITEKAIPMGATPLWLAAQNSNKQCAKLLLRRGAQIPFEGILKDEFMPIGLKVIQEAQTEIKLEKVMRRLFLAGSLLRSNNDSPLFKLPGDIKRCIFQFLKNND